MSEKGRERESARERTLVGKVEQTSSAPKQKDLLLLLMLLLLLQALGQKNERERERERAQSVNPFGSQIWGSAILYSFVSLLSE